MAEAQRSNEGAWDYKTLLIRQLHNIARIGDEVLERGGRNLNQFRSSIFLLEGLLKPYWDPQYLETKQKLLDAFKEEENTDMLKIFNKLNAYLANITDLLARKDLLLLESSEAIFGEEQKE